MKSVITCLLLLASVQAFASNDVVLKCSVREGNKKETTFDVVNPYGGGQVVQVKTAENGVISLTVMISENEDNRDLTNLQLLVSKSTDKSVLILSANGISKNKYNENGLSATLASDSLSNSVGVSCKM